MGSAAAVAVGWRHICCRHGCSENYDAKKHQCCNKTLPKGERGDYADDAVQRPQHNHNCPCHNGPGDGRDPDHKKKNEEFPLHGS